MKHKGSIAQVITLPKNIFNTFLLLNHIQIKVLLLYNKQKHNNDIPMTFKI